MVPALIERSLRTLHERRVPDETIADFHRAGFFRVLQPKRFGGSQLDFSVFARLVRELAHGCASSAWVYAVIAELGWVMAMFPEEAQQEVWANDLLALGCAAVDPAGKASIVPGGYLLSGRWPFVSGSDHAQWVFLTAPCEDARDPVVRQFLVRRSEVSFLDDWYVLGLVGTGSRSVVAQDVFVPAHRTITQADLLDGTGPGAATHPDAPTYRSPRRFLTAFSISPVLVGLADRALELAMASLRKRTSAGDSPELDAVRLRVAEATAEVATANLILDTTLAQTVSKLAAYETITEGDILRNRMLGAHMAQMARSAIARLGTVSGSGWVFEL